MDEIPSYTGYLLPPEPSTTDLRLACTDYATICRANIVAVADRFEQREDCPFIDTKLDLKTGRDFRADDPIRGRDAIYGWIQGRGLEALAGHAAWLAQYDDPESQTLAARLRAIAEPVLVSLRQMRAKNDGHLYFFMRPDGTPFALDDDGQPQNIPLDADAASNFSDLFCAKGMIAGARLLADEAALREATDYAQRVSADLWARRFVSDQQPLDPTNPIAHVPGRFDHGPYMINLGTCALNAAIGDTQAIEEGLRLIDYELAYYANRNGRISDFSDGDFWESIDDKGAPYRDGEGRVLCDPGHSLEFVGLALKFARAMRASGAGRPSQLRVLGQHLTHMPAILRQNFANGFLPGPGGICKAFDLVTRQHLNTDMPWWSLPETIRAAALCWRESADAETQQTCLQIWTACHNAFFAHFIRPEVHLMSIQTRCEDGSVSDSIPATADADPGYHTGLSLLDVIAAVNESVS